MVRPTVQLTFVDAGEMYVMWRWEHAPGEPHVDLQARAHVTGVLAELDRALPSPLPGESTGDALARALAGGPLTDPDRERDLSRRLADALIPPALAARLTTAEDRVHLRIQPSPSTARVPWEALRLGDGGRLVHRCDVSVLVPATVRNAPGRRVSPWDPGGPVVAVLDPVVPDLGPVLGQDERARVADEIGAVHADLDRDRLERALDGAARLLYVGHVTTAGHGLDARLHLSCGPATTGRAALLGTHRPLTAGDLVLGHRPHDPTPWRFPNRVAMVACESGADARFAEPTGLVTAMVNGGAEYVTSTRWVLPTDAGLARHGFAPAVTGVIVAVHTAHGSADPVAALGAWQRDLAARWDDTGDRACSPVLWGAFSTAYAPNL